MSMEVHLLGWSAFGLRCPDHKVDLCLPNTNQPYPVTLIQMPNGTGKTTTLNLLRATLSGEAKDWHHDKKKILSFKKNNGTNDFGQFIVRLSLDGNLITFELNFNFASVKVFYKTTLRSGIREGFEPPPQLKRFLNHEFVSLFIFDGELAHHLLDSKKTRAKEAIDALFQLSLLQELEKVFDTNWRSHVEQSSVTEIKGLNRRKNFQEQLENKIKDIEQERKQLKTKLSDQKWQIEKAKQEYNLALNQDQNTGEQLKEITEKLGKAKKEVDDELRTSIEEMRNPQKLLAEFGMALQNFKANLDRLKLPTSTSREFFEELAQANECVCGRPMDDFTREAVRDRALNYLAEDEVGVLNKIKSDIGEYCQDEPEIYHQDLREQLDYLSHLIRNRDDIETERQSIEAARLAKGDIELALKKKRLQELEKTYETNQSRLDEIERSPRSNPSKDTDCLKELYVLLEKAIQDVAEATNTLQLKEKTKIITLILSQAHEKARQELKKVIIEETNNRIAKLLTRDPIYIKNIRDGLELEGQQGASVGQTLSVSYAFLSTLFNRSDYQLPFIVDSPAGALDLNVRPKVARLIPNLCNQFVAFTISSERLKFVNILHQSVQEKVQYLTIYRKTAKTETLQRKIVSEEMTETDDGIMVNGKEFFNNFDLEEDEV